MRGGMIKGLVAGALLGGAAATIYGVMNWQTQRKWSRMAAHGGQWVADKTDELFGRK